MDGQWVLYGFILLAGLILIPVLIWWNLSLIVARHGLKSVAAARSERHGQRLNRVQPTVNCVICGAPGNSEVSLTDRTLVLCGSADCANSPVIAKMRALDARRHNA
jgi:hypothetical protein